MILRSLAAGVLLPAVLAATALLASRPWRAGARSGSWGAALGLGLGYGAGHAGLLGWPPFPPVETTQALPLVALAGALLGACAGLLRPPRRLVLLLGAGLALGAVWLAVRPRLEWSWEPGPGALRVAGLTAGVLLLGWLLEACSRRSPGALVPGAAGVAAAAGAAALALSGSALLGQLSGILAAGLGTTVALAWLLPEVRLLRGGVPVVALLLPSLWLNGVLYSDLPLASAVLLWLSPAAAGLALLPEGSAPRSGWPRTTAAWLAAAALAGTAALLAVGSGPAPYDPYA